MVKCIFKAVTGYNYQILSLSLKIAFVLRNSAGPDEMPTFETSLFAEVPGSKRMKPPMKQENKHSTYFRLFFVFKQLLRDCSAGQASRSRQN